MTSYEHTHDHHEHFEHQIQSERIQILSEYPLFERDAPITQYVLARVAHLAEDQDNLPTVYVRDSPMPNACVIGDSLVVDRGLFDLMDSTEEIDAILSHEMVHFDKGHVHGAKDLKGIAQLGKVRIHEIESDLRGMIRLDQKGINPRGMISAMEKLASPETLKLKEGHAQSPHENHGQEDDDAIDETPEWQHTSPTHGATRERAVNLEQAAWLIDLKHLSPAKLTPMQLETYGATEIEASSSQDINHHQAIVARRASELAKQDEPEPEAIADVIHMQQHVLEMSNPLLDSQSLAPIALRKYGIKQGQVTTYGEYAEVMQGLRHPAVEQVVGDTASERKDLAIQTLTEFLKNRQPNDQITEVANDALASVGDKAFDLRQEISIAAADVTHKDLTRSSEMRALVLETGAPIEPFRSKIVEHGMRDADPVREVIRDIAAHRYNHALSLESPVDFLHYLSKQTYQAIFESHGLTESTFDTQVQHEAHVWYRAAFTDSRDLFNELPMHEIAYNDFDDSFALPGGMLKMKDRVLANIVALCTTMTPTELGHTLAARDDLSKEDKIDIAHFWLDYRNSISNLTPEMHFETMGLLFSIGSPEFVKQAEGLLQKQISDRLRTVSMHEPGSKAFTERFSIKKTVDSFTRVIKKSVEGFVNTDEDAEHSNTLMEDLFNKSGIVRGYRTLAALEAFNAGGTSTRPFLTMLREGSIIRLDSTLFSEPEVLLLGRKYWDNAVEKALQRPNLADNETNLKLLMALGIVSDNVEINLHVPGSAFAKLVEERSFRKGIELVFETYDGLPHYVKAKAVDILIEQKAKTLEEFAELEKCLGRRLENLIDAHLAGIGAGSIIESVIVEAYKSTKETTRESGLMRERIYSADTVSLISALLTSAESDEAIKAYVFNRWWVANRYHEGTEDYFRVEDILTYRHRGKEARLAYWTKEIPPAGTYEPLSNIVDKLYLSDDNVRFMLVRKLMLGEGGILREEGGKEALVESFMGSWLQSEEGSTADNILRNILHSYLNSASAERVYQYISPVLQDLILKPPKESSSHAQLATARAQEIIDGLVERRKVDPRTLTGNEVPSVRNKIFYLMNGSSDLEEIQRSSDNSSLLDLFDIESHESFEQVSPTELALLVGKKSGSLGVRMLQLAGQYYDIPEEERPKFNEVYDSMKGQKRIQAYKLLKREAEDNPKMVELIDNIKLFGERLGGGSLMTVYAVTMSDGSKRVVGVRNPNAEFHVIQIADVLKKTLALATQNDPENVDLKIAETLLVDAVRWIRDELNDTDFVHKDPVFRMENDTRVGTGFQKGRSRYHLHVPQAYDTGTTWVRHEDFVPGVNLNNLVVSEEPTDLSQNKINTDDFKDVVSLLVRNSLHQIQNGTYAHSDGHGGNYRVTADNKSVAVFDRFNLIEMDDGLRDTIEKAITHIALGNRQQAVESIIAGVRSDLSSTQLTQVSSTVASRLNDEEDVAKGMMSTLIELKKTGIEIPINLSLILRNMFSMTQLSQKAGFDDIVGAFMHTASEAEVEALMQRFSQ